MTEEEIFHQALSSSPEERAAYLEQACAGDPTLRAAVEALLRANVGATGFLEQPAPALAAAVDEQPVRERPGTIIGSYKLLEQIGEGGFGVVFLAEQTRPVRRKVALKVLKPGMDTRQVVARFEAERQALALMDHPNIARVFDGGATPAGRPYFVMELVKGLPITEFCDQAHLTPRQRLALFMAVCQAVQHAHQKGIIHRDLKPSNVIVSRHDTTPVVKVIDFGVAKALGQELTDKTLFTGVAQMVGTPLYMSPEQAGMSDLDVDTRSDIYSLGVLLYELLTGTTPLTRERFQRATYDEIRRIIREEDPPRPSTRLSALKKTLPAVSALRHTEPARLTKLVRGELDWIVMKALEKDRNRRYESATAFAQDVQRYLDDEPVQACPPSVGYRLRKFVRRNKGTVLAAALVLLMFVAGFIATAGAMLRAVQAEALAVDEAKQKTAALKETEGALAAAKQSERGRTEQLCEALVAEARATRLSRRAGQRFQSLETLRRAAQLARGLELPVAKVQAQRNAATAALAVPDLHLAGPWVTCTAEVDNWDFDDDHAVCAWTDRQGACSIRRVADDVELLRLPGRNTLARLRLSGDGKFVAIMYIDRRDESIGIAVDVWQLNLPTPRRVLSEQRAHCAVFHPTAPKVALVDNDGGIGLFELPSGRRLSRLTPVVFTRHVTVALHPTEPLVAACTYHGSVVLLRDLTTGQVLAMLPQPHRPYSVTWHPDGRTLAVGMAEAHAIHLYDRATLRRFRTLETVSTASAVAFHPAGDRLAVVGWGGTVELFDVGTGQRLFATPPVSCSALRFRRDGRRLAGTARDGKLGTWQVGDSREYRTLVRKGLPPRQEYVCASVSPDGRLLAVGTVGGFGLWDLDTGSELVYIPKLSGNHLVHFEPSGSLLVLGPSGLDRWPISRDLTVAAGVVGPPEHLPLPRGQLLGQSGDGRVTVTCSRAVAEEAPHAGGWLLHADRPDQPRRLDAGVDLGFITVSPDGNWVVTGARLLRRGQGLGRPERQTGETTGRAHGLSALQPRRPLVVHRAGRRPAHCRRHLGTGTTGGPRRRRVQPGQQALGRPDPRRHPPDRPHDRPRNRAAGRPQPRSGQPDAVHAGRHEADRVERPARRPRLGPAVPAPSAEGTGSGLGVAGIRGGGWERRRRAGQRPAGHSRPPRSQPRSYPPRGGLGARDERGRQGPEPCRGRETGPESRRTDAGKRRLLEHARRGLLPQRRLRGGRGGPHASGPTPRGVCPRRVLPGHGALATGRKGGSPPVVRPGRGVDGKAPDHQQGVDPLPGRSDGTTGC